ncbi:AAA family ATPase [Glycomyces algeriensis]|uniref:Novel STAND NTPase 1 domain-containing protein n=1 Tax=Glycomyces algeriensis TaxID=256037 RepID=A0A9W6G843_9ACTN|nr:AAA family ATPase [Glycomyces algeriensis]MDA1364257.1 hypothetical protein [Glycomyces algeriensis]MDR7350285.1 WD40 repeat protein/energy-coupling factor transporter ATP-binding protein EcfA2 [Glycomyces algeriensis]GLI42994.1 hypothetical protein GALLR39Z86_28440 [Glycomyces algeriensis]
MSPEARHENSDTTPNAGGHPLPEAFGQAQQGLRSAVHRAPRKLVSGARPVVLGLLCASAFAPVAAAAIGAGVPVSSAIGVIGGVGGGLITQFVSECLDRLKLERPGKDPVVSDIEARLADDLTAVLESQAAEAVQLEQGFAAMMRNIDGTAHAMGAALGTGNRALAENLELQLRGIELLEGMRESQVRQEAGQRVLLEEVRNQGVLVEAIWRRETGDAGSRPAASSPWQGNPYLGLYPFEESHAQVFFGRRVVTADLLRRADEHHRSGQMLMVTGASGSGKSSLLRAGFAHAFKQSGFASVPGSKRWPFLVMRPEGDPLRSLAIAVAGMVGFGAAELESALRAAPDRFGSEVEVAVRKAGGDDSTRLVLVVDQFEELFTAGAASGVQQAFIDALGSMACTGTGSGDTRPPALVMLGMRGDFVDRCAEFELLGPALRQLFVLGSMSREEMRQAVTGPAKEAGIAIEVGLVDDILDDARDSSGDDSRSAGALPLLSEALRQMLEQGDGQWLTRARYEAVGFISGAVRNNAEQAHERLSDRQQAVAQGLFRHLTTFDSGKATRRAEGRGRLLELLGPEVDAVIEAFTRKRLLVIGGRGIETEASVEIAHECMYTRWKRLHGWIEADRESLARRSLLRDATAEWRLRGGDTSLLFQGSRLKDIVDEKRTVWDRDPLKYPLNQEELDFLEASERFRRRRSRMRQALVSGLASLTAVSVTLAALVFNSNQDLTAERNQALSKELAAESEALRGNEGELAMLLAAAAWRLHETDEAFAAMTDAVNDPSVGLLSNDRMGTPAAVAFSPDGSRLAGLGENGVVAIWSTATWEVEVLDDLAQGGGYADVEFSPDGTRLAANSKEGVKIWDLDSSEVVQQFGPAFSHDVTFSADGSMLAVADGDSLGVWDLQDAKEIARFEGYYMTSAAFSTDGSTLITGTGDGVVSQWAIDSGDLAATDTLGDIGQAEVWTSHDDPAYTAACSDLGCSILDSEGHWEPWLQGQAVKPAASSDATTVAAIHGTYGALALWDGESGRLLVQLPMDHVRNLSFQPGDTILAGVVGEGIRLWDTAKVASVPWAFTLPEGTASPTTLESARDSAAVMGVNSGATMVWEVPTEEDLEVPPSAIFPEIFGYAIAMHPSGSMVAGNPEAEETGRIELLDVRTGQVIDELDDGGGPAIDLEFSADGSMLAVGRLDTDTTSHDTDEVVVWSVATGQTLLRIPTGAGEVGFSPDGKSLITVDSDGRIHLWNVDSGKRSDTLEGGMGLPYDLKFNNDGSVLAAATTNGLAQWDIDSGAAVGPAVVHLQGHDLAGDLSFSPDDRFVAFMIAEELVFWDRTLGRQIASESVDLPWYSKDVTFVADEWKVAVVTDEGANIFDVGFLEDPYAAVCEQAGRHLTREEWKTYLRKIDYGSIEVCT